MNTLESWNFLHFGIYKEGDMSATGLWTVSMGILWSMMDQAHAEGLDYMRSRHVSVSVDWIWARLMWLPDGANGGAEVVGIGVGVGMWWPMMWRWSTRPTCW